MGVKSETKTSILVHLNGLGALGGDESADQLRDLVLARAESDTVEEELAGSRLHDDGIHTEDGLQDQRQNGQQIRHVVLHKLKHTLGGEKWELERILLNFVSQIKWWKLKMCENESQYTLENYSQSAALSLAQSLTIGPFRFSVPLPHPFEARHSLNKRIDLGDRLIRKVLNAMIQDL